MFDFSPDKDDFCRILYKSIGSHHPQACNVVLMSIYVSSKHKFSQIMAINNAFNQFT